MSDTASDLDLTAIEQERDRIREAHLRPSGQRPPSTARGLHHTALISSDVERTVRFYQDVLGFPLTELIENRDYPGSSHFFFDIGNGNLIAFFDFPGLDVGPQLVADGGDHLVEAEPPGDQDTHALTLSGDRGPGTPGGPQGLTRRPQRSAGRTT